MDTKKNLSHLAMYVSSLIKDSENLEDDLKLIKIGINRLLNTAKELDIFANRIQSNVDLTKSKIHQAMEYILKYVEAASSEKLDKKTKEGVVVNKPETALKKVEVLAVNKEDVIKEKEYNTTKRSSGIMIFINPDRQKKRKSSGESTVVPRRQLVPTTQEEKMILDYLIRNDHKPTQKEYNNLYKEVCNMLFKVPKNAIAIEIRTADPKKDKKFIELFYHIKIKNKNDFACLTYIEITGVEAYRAMGKEKGK